MTIDEKFQTEKYFKDFFH